MPRFLSRFTVPWATLTIVLFWAPFTPGGAQDAPPSTPEATSPATPTTPVAPTTPPAPELIAIPDIVATADSSSAFLKTVNDFLGFDALLGTGLPDIVVKIDAREAAKTSLLRSQPTLGKLRDAEAEWIDIDKALVEFKTRLSQRVAKLEEFLNQIDALDGRWSVTLKGLEASDADETPPEVLARVNGIISSLRTTREQVIAERSRFLSTQEKVAEQEKRSSESLEQIRKARETTVTELFVRLHPPLWKIDMAEDVRSGLAKDIPAAVSTQWADLQRYLKQHAGTILAHGTLLGFLIVAMMVVARRVKGWVRVDPELEKPCFVFDFPYSTAAIVAIACGIAFYPFPPSIWRSFLIAVALFPTLRILKRPLARPLWPVLNSLVVFFIANRLCALTIGVPLVERLLFLAEMLGGVLFFGWLLRTRLSEARAESATDGILRLLRKAAIVVLVFFSVAFLADFFGYLALARQIGAGAITSALLAAFLRASVRIADGLVIFLLRSKPLRLLGMAKRHRSLIERRLDRLVRIVALIVWIVATLETFSLLQPTFNLLRDILTASLPVREFRVSLWDFVLFGGAVYASILISRFARFILAEEVFPRAHLPRGMPFAISTVVHYTLLLIGFFLALGIAGIDLTRITVLVGALGVGIGFGLQNIVNNFVSGLILLFERPVNVGDMIEVNAQYGELRRIGLRASVLRTPDGSEIIVPNGDLISNQVKNWTLNDQHRRLEIPVGVAYGTDPERVIGILLAIADKNGAILKNPPPQALFTAFGESSLDFLLRCWTDEYQRWPIIRSEISTAILHALEDENISIPFPQRDLHVISMTGSDAKPVPDPSPPA